MIRALIATAATAAVSSAAWYLYKSGKLDGPIDSAARLPWPQIRLAPTARAGRGLSRRQCLEAGPGPSLAGRQ